MAPKCLLNSKFSLIYWIDTPYKDIIKTTIIPKSRRLVGEVVKLKWQGPTGKSQSKDAKIIAFSDDEKYLGQIRLNDNGEICGPNVRMFHKAIIQKKNDLGAQGKNKRKYAKVVHKTIESAIKLQPCIVKELQISATSASTSLTPPAEIIEKENGPLDLTPAGSSATNQTAKLVENVYDAGKICMESNDGEGETEDGKIEKSCEKNSILYALIDQEVTNRDLKFFGSILRRLEEIFQKGGGFDPTKISEQYLTPGLNKEEFSPRSGIFLPASKIKGVMEQSKCQNDKISWKKIVKNVLEEIYGENLGKFSAQGKRQKDHPGIDKKLFKGLYESIQLVTNETISTLEFISEINKITCNKRKLILNKNNSPCEVTEEGITFFRKVFKSLEKSKTLSEHSNPDSQISLPELPQNFVTEGSEKVRISENSNLVLPRSIVAYLERKSEAPSGEINWKELVRNTLIEVYKDDMRLYSATGKRSSFPAIHSELYTGLYGWINSKKTTEVITAKAFNRTINKLASSKRETFKRTKGSTMLTTEPEPTGGGVADPIHSESPEEEVPGVNYNPEKDESVQKRISPREPEYACSNYYDNNNFNIGQPIECSNYYDYNNCNRNNIAYHNSQVENDDLSAAVNNQLVYYDL